MVERVRNVIKADNKKTKRSGVDYPRPPSPKRHKKSSSSLVRCYPVSSYEIGGDSATMDRHKAAIADEIRKGKPRDTLLLPLLKTFGERMFIINEATSVTDVLKHHPALVRTAVVSFITVILMCIVCII